MANGFDKDAAKKPASKGKIATMIGLAVVLGGVVFFHFTSTPQTADGAPNPNAQPDLDSLGSPSEQIEALKNNPTRNLLLTTTAPVASTDDLRTNPFAMSDKWYIVLNPPKPEHPGNTGPIITEPVGPRPPSLPPIDLAAIKAKIKLQGIFAQNGQHVAFIGGKMLSAGALVGEAQIVEILEDRIICQVPKYGQEGRFEIPLNP